MNKKKILAGEKWNDLSVSPDSELLSFAVWKYPVLLLSYKNVWVK